MATRKGADQDLTKQAFVLQQIRDQIVDGRYPPGSRLPLRTDMETIYGVSWFTLHRVFEQLTGEGFVHSRGRGGTYVCDHPPHLSFYAVVAPRSMPDDRRQVLQEVIDKLQNGRKGKTARLFLVDPSPDNDDHRELLTRLDNHTVAGLVLLDGTDKWLARDLASHPRVPRITPSCKPDDELAVVVDRDWSAFLDRGCEALKLAGCTRVGLLLPVDYLETSLESLPQSAARHSLTGRAEWVLVSPESYPDYAAKATSLLMSLPEASRPDGLMLGCAGLSDPVYGLLAERGLSERVHLVVQSDTTDGIEPRNGLTPICFDPYDLMYRCFDAIDRLRAGQDVPKYVTVPPRGD